MIREDLIEGAVSFLQDPSVATAPVEQKIAFLRSKNLTQEEVDASLARVSQPATNAGPAPPSSNYSTQYRGPPQQYGGYQQPPYWAQPPPEVPRRDWRDWFIMATVVGGASYAVYWTAKQYIYPLIAPPTPPQLEQDKASIDASFDKAFNLLDQLATDTQELKDSEKARSERLDRALEDVEAVVRRIKEANETRDLESKRLARELDDIRDQIPRALEKEKERMDGRLSDLASEMKSLKTLMAGRVGAPARTTPGFPGNGPVAPASSNGVLGQQPAASQTAVPETNGIHGSATDVQNTASSERAATPPSSGRVLGSGKAQIPSWQLAAKKKTEESKAGQDVSQSGTVTSEGVGE